MQRGHRYTREIDTAVLRQVQAVIAQIIPLDTIDLIIVIEKAHTDRVERIDRIGQIDLAHVAIPDLINLTHHRDRHNLDRVHRVDHQVERAAPRVQAVDLAESPQADRQEVAADNRVYIDIRAYW